MNPRTMLPCIIKYEQVHYKLYYSTKNVPRDLMLTSSKHINSLTNNVK